MPIFEYILSIHNVHESYTRICMDTCIRALLLQHIASHTNTLIYFQIIPSIKKENDFRNPSIENSRLHLD